MQKTYFYFLQNFIFNNQMIFLSDNARDKRHTYDCDLGGRIFRREDLLPSTKALGGLWYTEARLEMLQINSSNSVGSIRSVSSEMSGFSAKTTSLAAAGSVERSLQYM